MQTLYHGAHTRFALHVGQCFTPDEDVAYAYAGGSDIVACVELDLSELVVREFEGYDWDADEAPGDDLERLGELGVGPDVDVLEYDDADPTGREHRTYRLVSERALEAVRLVEVSE